MGEIYSQAVLVRVWLGWIPHLKAKLVFGALKDLDKNPQRYRRCSKYNGVFCRPTTNQSIPDECDAAGACHYEKEVAIDLAIKNDYWSRDWIVQEYVLVRRIIIHANAYSMEGTAFAGALDKMTVYCKLRSKSLSMVSDAYQ